MCKERAQLGGNAYEAVVVKVGAEADQVEEVEGPLEGGPHGRQVGGHQVLDLLRELEERVVAPPHLHPPGSTNNNIIVLFDFQKNTKIYRQSNLHPVEM